MDISRNLLEVVKGLNSLKCHLKDFESEIKECYSLVESMEEKIDQARAYDLRNQLKGDYKIANSLSERE